MTVRPARAGDHDALTGVMVRAFEEDPMFRWVYPDACRRARHGEGFFRWTLWRFAEHGVSWTTEDRAGAAVWALPGRWAPTTPQLARFARITWHGVGRRIPLATWGLLGIERRHPDDRHLYLALLGVGPDRQGAGLGSALLVPGLELCDREGLPAYLETTKERNLAFYGRHGFAVTGELRLPRGPRVWLMRRVPR